MYLKYVVKIKIDIIGLCSFLLDSIMTIFFLIIYIDMATFIRLPLKKMS